MHGGAASPNVELTLKPVRALVLTQMAVTIVRIPCFGALCWMIPTVWLLNIRIS